MLIDEKVIDPEILSMKFACDTTVCKGACCTFPGGYGPPLLPEELDQIRNCYPAIRHYLPIEHREIADRYGCWEQVDGDFFLRCFKGRACIFVMYSGSTAECALQHAYSKGELDFVKPQSCHLFPIRVRGKNRDMLVFERFSECESAYDLGLRRDISAVEFLQTAIERVFGSDFFHRLAGESRRSPE